MAGDEIRAGNSRQTSNTKEAPTNREQTRSSRAGTARPLLTNSNLFQAAFFGPISNMTSSSILASSSQISLAGSSTSGRAARIKANRNANIKRRDKQEELKKAINTVQKNLDLTSKKLEESARTRTKLKEKMEGLQKQLREGGKLPKDNVCLLSEHPTQEEVDGLMRLLSMAKERARRHKLVKSLEEKERRMQEAVSASDQLPDWSMGSIMSGMGGYPLK